jgi:hypothetical protein
MKLAALEAFLDRVNDVIDGCHFCKYGHVACSDKPSGRCADEAWQRQCDDESDEDYEERMEGK